MTASRGPTLRWWVDAPAPGAANMRVDRDLLERAEHDAEAGAGSAVTLRVYGWSPPAVSLGFHQDESELDLDALRRDGIDLVRRPTGGAAVLHDREITYAVVGRLGVPGLGRRVLEIHDAIADCLRDTLTDLGVDARREGDGRPSGFACFAAAGGHEITVGGRKLVGSALRRTRHAFLQHGSLLVDHGHERLPLYVHGAGGGAEVERLRARTVTLRELGRGDVDPSDFARRLGEHLAERIEATSITA